MVIDHPLLLVLPTRISPPQFLDMWVPRERLLSELGAITAQVTLIIAPAGFGKSTLVAQWLLSWSRMVGTARQSGAAQAPVAWLTLDEHDQDGLRVLTYLAAAVEHALPGALATTRELLNAPQPAPLYAVLEAFLVELDALPAGLTLVLDDYHTLSTEPVHQLMAYLLRHLPRACRLVLISRTDPPLPLARLRAERQLAELRAADLRFTPAETVALLTALEGTPPHPARAAALHAQTEGWPIALHLAALAGTDGRLAEALPGRARRQIAEYLADEVLARQAPELQAALPALAVPERFCAELVAALLGAPEQPGLGETLIERLEAKNLFVIPLDGEGRWYRFHPLFRDLLRRRLRQTGEACLEQRLQQRAAAWLAADGQVEEAVRLYLAAGDDDAAARLVEEHMIPEMDNDVATEPLSVRLDLLPRPLIARRPGLSLIEARLAVFRMDIEGLEAALAHIDAMLASTTDPDQVLPWASATGDLVAMRGILTCWKGRSAEAIRELHRALTLRPAQALAIQTLLLLSLAYILDGRYHEGVRLFHGDGFPDIRATLGRYYEIARHTSLSWMHILAGDVTALMDEARQMAELVAAEQLGDLWFGYAAHSLARAHYESNRLVEAEAQFKLVTQRKYRVSYPGYLNSVIGLALIASARECFSEAEGYIEEALLFARTVGGSSMLNLALGGAARVALARGDLAAALRYASEIGPDIFFGMRISFETPQLSQTQVWITVADREYLERAEVSLSSHLATIEKIHNQRLLVTALGLQALLRQAQQRPLEALKILERAVRLAEPHAMVRTLVDLGPALRPLLRSLAQRGVATAYLEGVLAAFAPLPVTGQPLQPVLPARLPEMLTRRESEILALLAERWSNQEIADRLSVTVNTVRKHTSTIYDKLGVSSRREAVAVGRTLGLLPQ
ncbi:MAG: LuxR C-terminal-related transcriptional regulator [Chloroflexaceae bacterium]